MICHTLNDFFSELSYQRDGGLSGALSAYIAGWRANSIGLLAVTPGNKLAFLAFHNSMMMVLSFPMTPFPFRESSQCSLVRLFNTPKSQHLLYTPSRSFFFQQPRRLQSESLGDNCYFYGLNPDPYWGSKADFTGPSMTHNVSSYYGGDGLGSTDRKEEINSHDTLDNNVFTLKRYRVNVLTPPLYCPHSLSFLVHF